MSLPNRHVYPAGNPHHIKELASDELEALLRKGFGTLRSIDSTTG